MGGSVGNGVPQGSARDQEGHPDSRLRVEDSPDGAGGTVPRDAGDAFGMVTGQLAAVNDDSGPVHACSFGGQGQQPAQRALKVHRQQRQGAGNVLRGGGDGLGQ